MILPSRPHKGEMINGLYQTAFMPDLLPGSTYLQLTLGLLHLEITIAKFLSC